PYVEPAPIELKCFACERRIRPLLDELEKAPAPLALDQVRQEGARAARLILWARHEVGALTVVRREQLDLGDRLAQRGRRAGLEWQKPDGGLLVEAHEQQGPRTLHRELVMGEEDLQVLERVKG